MTRPDEWSKGFWTIGSFDLGSTHDHGQFALGDVALDVREGAVRNSDGTLAGSSLTLSSAVTNDVELGIDPSEALRAVTASPAALADATTSACSARVRGPT